jgi:hypothetical protein
VLSVALDEAAPRLPLGVAAEGEALEVSYSTESLPDATRLGLVPAAALAEALGGQLVATASDGTVSLRVEPPLEAARAA